MLNYIRDTFYRQSTPPWMKDTRYECLFLRDKWLEGKFYDCIPLCFEEEKTGNHYNLLRDWRPAIQQNFPHMIAGLTARKLFAGRHVPRLKHENKDFLLQVQALIEELKMPVRMLEAIKRGSVGSVLVLFKFLEVTLTDGSKTVKGVVEVKQTQYCTPKFNKFEELTAVLEHYLVSASELHSRNMHLDFEGETLDDNKQYWYIKLLDTTQECIYRPIPEHDWNPMNGGKVGMDALKPYPFKDEDNPFVHNLGFVQGIWIKNLTGGQVPEGDSTWEAALNNFIEIDYVKSQNDRGLKYNATPQLMIKGDLKAEAEGEDGMGPIQRGGGSVLRVAADVTTMGQESSSGHDAKLLETSGASAKAADDFTRQLKQTSLEQISAARKDMESIKGSISGKVIELIDEDFLDLLEELRLMYIYYGYLPLMKIICKAAKLAGHLLMPNATDNLIDGLTVECPPFYLPDAQDIQFLTAAMVEASSPQLLSEGGGGEQAPTTIQVEPLIDPVIASQFLAKQLDLVEVSEDRPVLQNTQTDTEHPPEPKPEAEILDQNTDIVDALAGGPIGNAPQVGNL